MGVPLTVTVGMPARGSAATRESIVGSRLDADASQDPSTNRIEFPPTRERLETDASIVREEVRFWRSSIRGSWTLETPST